MLLNVLFVDDEPDLCDVFIELFTSEGTKIHAVSDPNLAIELCKTIQFDVAFLDFRMPGTNGDKLAHQINQKFPVYLLTGEGDPTITFPFKEVLRKPIDNKKIRMILDKLFQTIG